MASKSQANPKGRSGRGRAAGSKKAGSRASNGRGRADGQGGEDRDILERGDIFFFYRPVAEESAPGGLLDVNRFHLVLRPEGKETLRYLTIGKKKLPGDDGDRRNWGFMDGVFASAEELKQALVDAGRAAARPAGEGVYALARRGRNTVLAYALELPEEPGEVQRALGIEREGRLTLVIKNPEAASPGGVGLDDGRKAEFPEELRTLFGDRKWVGADPPEFLDHEGAELVLIAGEDRGEDLGIILEPEPEDEESAEVFRDLHLEALGAFDPAALRGNLEVIGNSSGTVRSRLPGRSWRTISPSRGDGPAGPVAPVDLQDGSNTA